MTTSPPILTQLRGVTTAGGGWTARCPAHEDNRNSLSIGLGDDGRVLLHCHAGCSVGDICAAIGLRPADLFPSRELAGGNGHRGRREITNTYDYRDADGTLLYQAVRYRPKGFVQRRPDGAGGWLYRLDGTPRVLYLLPEVVVADPQAWIFVVEGEKDADRLRSLGLVATCNAGGAGKWHTLSDTSVMQGRLVAVLPDNDGPGRKHAEQVAQALHGQAADVRVVTLPDLADKGDVSDWLGGGGTVEGLLALTEAAPTWAPATKTAPASLVTPAAIEDAIREGLLCTDTGNAHRFVSLHGDDVRYAHGLGWYTWDGKAWREDTGGRATELGKTVAGMIFREALAAHGSTADALRRWAMGSASAPRLRAMLELAQSDPRVSVQPDDLDADPDLLNVENGTIHLPTGALREHSRANLCTKITGAGYDATATHPVLTKVLHDATGSDRDMIGYVQRMYGSALYGHNLDEHVYILLGDAATGKTTIFEAVRAAAGGYAMSTAFETFLARQVQGGHSEDIAALRGARIVLASECPPGSRLALAKIKHISGEEVIRARKLYQHEIEFRPACTVFLASNDPPVVPHDDSGLWRRLRRLPFTHVVPETERDPAVKRTLVHDPEARAATLAWLIQGARDWHEYGLGTCAAVEAATVEYRAESDPLKDFIADNCIIGSGYECVGAQLRQAYASYADEMGVRHAISPRAFGLRLRALGCEVVSRAGRRIWRGIGLRHEVPE